MYLRCLLLEFVFQCKTENTYHLEVLATIKENTTKMRLGVLGEDISGKY